MEELTQNSPNSPQEGKLKLIALLLGLILVLTFSLVNFYQVKKVESEFREMKAKIEKWEAFLNKKEALEIVGMARYSELEGGCWYLETTDLKCLEEKKCLPQYEPTSLPEDLKGVGTKAKFKLEVQPEVATTCQIGPAVKVLEYQIIK